jgi:hypothetical protein
VIGGGAVLGIARRCGSGGFEFGLELIADGGPFDVGRSMFDVRCSHLKTKIEHRRPNIQVKASPHAAESALTLALSPGVPGEGGNARVHSPTAYAVGYDLLTTPNNVECPFFWA